MMQATKKGEGGRDVTCSLISQWKGHLEGEVWTGEDDICNECVGTQENIHV